MTDFGRSRKIRIRSGSPCTQANLALKLRCDSHAAQHIRLGYLYRVLACVTSAFQGHHAPKCRVPAYHEQNPMTVNRVRNCRRTNTMKTPSPDFNSLSTPYSLKSNHRTHRDHATTIRATPSPTRTRWRPNPISRPPAAAHARHLPATADVPAQPTIASGAVIAKPSNAATATAAANLPTYATFPANAANSSPISTAATTSYH